MAISAFIPVFKYPKHLEALVRSLSEEAYSGSETVVVIDGETTAEIAQALEKIRVLPRVRIIEGIPHCGKAAALNRASRFCRSDKFIFLDNDINPIPGVDIFAGCSAMLEASDLVELSKEAVGEGPIAAMMKHEFLVNLWGTRIFVDGTGRNPLMNGAAFAVRKSLFRQLGGFAPVINEDIDFAARAFLENARFGIDPALRVQNDVPSSPADWLSQRKRWAISFGLWNATYARKLREKAPETARFRASATTIFYLPFLTATAAFTSIIIGLSERGESQFGLFTASSVAAFLIVGLHCAKEAKYFGQEFSWISYVFFSLVYCPIWAISSVLGIAVVALKGVPEMDWEYGRYTDTGKGHQRS